MSGTWRYFLAALAAAAVAGAGCDDDEGGGAGGGDAGPAVCGNGIVESGEICDDGNPKSGDGCEADCTYSCDADNQCNDGDSCDGDETCHPTLHRCQAGAPREDGEECSYFVQVLGVDGGANTIEERTDGICISQVCGKPCTLPADCDDGNACTGTETCGSGIYTDNCAPGEPLVCGDDLACTADACDPLVGCTYTLIDGDTDGFADDDLACDARGGDCDDGDDTVFPGAPELCSDGKDNDCDGLADSADPQQPTWYQDCDADGFAPMGALSLTQCLMPATTPECASWTTRTPSGLSNTDCDDTTGIAYPGAENKSPGTAGFYSRPYCRGTGGALAVGTAPSFTCATGSGGPGGTLTWDYNCNNTTDYRTTAVSSQCAGGLYYFSCTTDYAWTAESYPYCGYTAEINECGYPPCQDIYCLYFCQSVSTFDRMQTCR